MKITEEFQVPSNSLQEACCCAFDFDGSVGKVSYVTKHPEGPQEGDTDKVTVRCCQFSMEKLNDVLQEIKDNTSRNPGCIIKAVDSSLKEDIKQMMEAHFQCNVQLIKRQSALMVDGFHFCLNNLPKSSILQDLSPGVWEKSTDLHERTSKLFYMFNPQLEPPQKDSNNTGDVCASKEVLVQSAEQDPFLLLSIGPTTQVFLVQKDGSGEVAGTSFLGSKMVLGLASLLLGSLSLDELCALADNGDDQKVSQYMLDLKGDAQDASYDAFPDDMLIFPFGKAINTSEFEKEDLARALVVTLCQQTADFLAWLSRAHKCDRIYVTGELAAYPLVRDKLFEISQ